MAPPPPALMHTKPTSRIRRVRRRRRRLRISKRDRVAVGVQLGSPPRARALGERVERPVRCVGSGAGEDLVVDVVGNLGVGVRRGFAAGDDDGGLVGPGN